MDTDLYKEAIDYELLTQTVYQTILDREGERTISVQHNASIAGRSGVEHQIDVFWEFRQAGIKHKVLIECKNYASNLTLEKTRNFFAVTHDIGNCTGIMVTKTGYQSGAAAFCEHYGIAMKLLRKPTEKDWEGHVKTIRINMIPRVPVTIGECAPVCSMYLRATSAEQDALLRQIARENPDIVRAAPEMCFLDKNGQPVTEELKWWLPKQLNVLQYEDGGPYRKAIELIDHYVPVDLGNGDELVQVIGVVIEFHVETLESHQTIIDASEIVDTILKDFSTGAWEHMQPKA